MLSSTTVITTLLHILRVKVVALLLGPSGVAIIAQLNQFLLTAANLASFGSAPGVIRFAAKYASSNQKETLQTFIFTLFASIAIGTGVFLAFGIPLKSYLSYLLLKDTAYSYLVLFAILGVPATAFFINIRSMINGFLEISTYARLTILSVALNLLIIGPMIYFFHLFGAGLHIFIMSFFSLGIAFYELRRIQKARKISVKRGKYDRTMLMELLKYGATSLISTVAIDSALMGVRVLIIHQLSETEAGIFQAAFVISAQVITVIISSMGSYAYPRISELNSTEEAIRESNHAIRLALFTVTPLVIFVYSLRDEFIILFYSQEFLLAANIIAWQLIGNFIRAISSSIGVLLLPFRHLKAFWLVETGQSMIFFFAAFALLPRFGLEACTIAYALAYTFHFVALYTYLKWKMAFRIERKNLKLLLLSGVLIFSFLIILKVDFLKSWYWIIPTLVLWAAISIEKEERHAIITLIQQRLKH